MITYLDRDDARDALRTMGVKVGKNGLANMACEGIGPKYYLINGRALYKHDELVAWVAEQANRPVPKRNRALRIAPSAA